MAKKQVAKMPMKPAKLIASKSDTTKLKPVAIASGKAPNKVKKTLKDKIQNSPVSGFLKGVPAAGSSVLAYKAAVNAISNKKK